jgi:hypothetical protein
MVCYFVPCYRPDDRLFCHLQLACSFHDAQDADPYRRTGMAIALQNCAVVRI